MAIPACVDPTACGTNVTFNTSGIKVDVELDNVGCGVDLSCSAAGVRADARVLAGGGLLCDAGSRSLYVNRLGSTAAANPSGCGYSPVNVTPTGGLWTPKEGIVGRDGVADPPYLAIPGPGDGAVKTFVLPGTKSFTAQCDERWQGHCIAKINLEADVAGAAWVCINFALDITGAGVTHTQQNTRITASLFADATRLQCGQWVWIPFIADVDAGATGTFLCRANMIERFNVAASTGQSPGPGTPNNCMEFEGIQFTRFAR